MAGTVYEGVQYRLRASSPMPVGGSNFGTAAFGSGNFALHTFGAEVNQVDMFECTTDLPSSTDFRGQGVGGDLISANFSRIGEKTGSYFQGRQVHAPTYTEEDDFSLL